MRLSLRLRYQKKRTLVLSILAFICCMFLYLLIKHRPSLLSPDSFGHAPEEDYIHAQQLKLTRYPIPGSFIERNVPSNYSYCHFKYNLPGELNYRESDLKFSPQLGGRGTYRVLYNVIEGQEQLNNYTGPPSITYCTHLTPHFVYHIAEIVRYWETAISVAAFVPDVDADVTVQLLKHLCHCLPGMRRLSVHFVFPDNRPPYVVQRSNSKSKCLVPDVTDLETYRNRENLPYPVNVCRNVARTAARTSHVLVSDVELIPSDRLATKFIDMLQHVRIANVAANHVFVVPVFEVDSGVSVPRNKVELKRLYDDEKAVYFHRWVCQHCQKFPGLVKWLNKPTNEDVIKPFIVARREDPFHRWEPIYIGTNKEPFYSETLSWEGQQDKMTQMVEMCLIGYKFVILDGAFLVHWPGIKRRTTESKVRNAWRKPHQRQNTKQYDVIINYLASKYTENDKCKL
ncbi:uncharacterized protein CBL_01491 [Carabus blaptoides fortunei]